MLEKTSKYISIENNQQVKGQRDCHITRIFDFRKQTLKDKDDKFRESILVQRQAQRKVIPFHKDHLWGLLMIIDYLFFLIFYIFMEASPLFYFHEDG